MSEENTTPEANEKVGSNDLLAVDVVYKRKPMDGRTGFDSIALKQYHVPRMGEYVDLEDTRPDDGLGMRMNGNVVRLTWLIRNGKQAVSIYLG